MAVIPLSTRRYVTRCCVALVVVLLVVSLGNKVIFGLSRDDPFSSIKQDGDSEGSWSNQLQVTDVSNIVVTVVMCGCDSAKMESITSTWSNGLTRIVFLLPAGCSMKPSSSNIELGLLPTVKNNSPSSQLAASIQYLAQKHYHSYMWFVIVPSDTYVNVETVGSYLSKLNPEEPVYLGQLPVNQSEERLSRVPHERSCVGGPGIVLSRAAMNTVLDHHQADIIQSIQQHLHHHDQPDMDKLFYEDIQQSFMNPDQLWSKDQYSGLLTVYPATLPDHMVTLHLLYKTLEYEQLRTRMATVGNTINNLHERLKRTIHPKKIIHAHNFYDAPEIDGKSLTHGNLPPYTLFQGDSLYDDHSVEPSRGIGYETVEYTKEIQLLKPKIEEIASSQYGAWLKLKEIQYYYVLRHGLKGNRYVVDAVFRATGKPRKPVVKMRVDLVRPLSKEIVVNPSKLDSDETVNFVIPVGNVIKRFLDFLPMYEKELVAHRENVRLIVVVYGEEDTATVKQKMKEVAARRPSFRHIVVEGGPSNKYTRSRAFEKGMSELKDNDLAFLCDVDLNVQRGFLQRCRRSAVQGKTVYFPEMFKLYNMKYVYWDSKPPRNPPLNRKHGFWEYYSYGMACMYKSDYSTMDQSLVGWGGEDVDFIVKTLKKKLEVFRAPDTSLVHRWHDNPCKTRNADSHFHCVFSTMRTYADRIALAKYVLHLEDQLKKKH